ncbi:hypothetical protein HGRIS_000857 [Hohenbuehelia grisea]|uniref:Uncharacterized protein n=1 Tax=Hohenbuehelia grisea TaxID=104357 RepID=A0ABR3IQ34_9AGAR
MHMQLRSQAYQDAQDKHVTRLFIPDQHDILTTIIEGAPLLAALKLTESLPNEFSNISPRPFDNVRRWANELQRLQRLKCLLIKTAGLVVGTAGDHVEEGQVIKSWCGGHKHLSDMTIWYRVGQMDHTLSQWGRDGDEWRLYLQVPHPEDDSSFV